jgi:hypothetical protein
MSEDGTLDILQITVQLEAAASEAWKPMIRETILSCNDVISASKSQYCILSLHSWFIFSIPFAILQKFRTRTQKYCTLSQVKIAAFCHG